MRALKLMLIMIAAAGFAPYTVRAAAITQVFNITVFPAATLTGTNNFAGSNFAEFNPTLGTLDNIMTTLTGSATVTGSLSNLDIFTALVLHNDGEAVALSSPLSGPGVVNIDISGTDSFAPDLATLTGTGTTTLDLRLLSTRGDTFATSATGLLGLITYNYTPSPAVPEPSSLALLGIGLAGLAFFHHRKRDQHLVGRDVVRGSVKAA